MPYGVSPYMMTDVRRCRRRRSYKVRRSYISRTVWPRITKFYRKTFTPVGPATIPDMGSLCTSGWKLSTFEKGPKMTPQTALGRILLARRFASPPIGGILVIAAYMFCNFCNPTSCSFLVVTLFLVYYLRCHCYLSSYLLSLYEYICKCGLEVMHIAYTTL